MSFHLYHTDAIVLGGAHFGEGSKVISLFTREFGLLSASAKSVREERSKLRYGLQDFSYSNITLVRGKEFWRLTNAELISDVIKDKSKSLEAVLMVGRICALLRRLLAGEERNEPLFTAVLEGFQFFGSTKDKGLLEGAEIVLVLRILYSLGYLAPRNEFSSFLKNVDIWNESLISNALIYRALAISEINNSLRETQL